MTFEEARAQFPVVERFAYLNAGTLGPLSRVTIDAMEARTRSDHELGRGGKAWFDSVTGLRERVRAALGGVIAADVSKLALTSSTTDGCNIVLSGLDLAPGDEIVTTDAEHPGLLLPLHASGATVRVAPVSRHPAAHAAELVRAAIGPRTRLIALSHVIWTTGQVIPVHDLKAETGLPMLVDGAQSVGAIPVDVGDIDFYTVSCQKWLCGPEPLGALYVRAPELLRVAIPSYFAKQSIEPDGAYVPKPGAPRFDSGWLPSAGLAGLEAALVGAPDWRYERAAEMAARCRAALAGAGLEVVTEPGQATLVSFRSPGDATETAASLYAKRVILRDLPGTGWLRASCGWWTNDEDVERLVAGLAG